MTKKSILVVDDEESIRFSLKRMLAKDNYRVETADNGSIALKKLANDHYDIVLTDIMMDDISGIELLQSIKGKYANVLIILMTGYASITSAIDALRSGATDYIIKPCSKKIILSSIENAIKNKKTSEDINHSLKVLSGKKPLTIKESLVCEHLLHGLKSDDIATKLDVTLPTIKFHLKNIYSKLGIKGRREIFKVMQSN